MVQYIYFVKCPNCEDEHFDFFDEAKEFALGCLGSKPVITQVEVCRNDFGECTDSIDHGVQWSWEDEATVEDDAAINVFTKGDFANYNPDNDPEFDAIDNSVNFVLETSGVSAIDDIPDNFCMPVTEESVNKFVIVGESEDYAKQFYNADSATWVAKADDATIYDDRNDAIVALSDLDTSKFYTTSVMIKPTVATEACNSKLVEGSFVSKYDYDRMTKDELYSHLVDQGNIVEITVGDQGNYETSFSDGGRYSDSILEVEYKNGLFEIVMWNYSDDGDMSEDDEYEFSTESFDELWEEVMDFSPEALREASCIGGCKKTITEEEKHLAVNKKGDYLVKASSGGNGYTVFNGSNVCIGGFESEDDDHAITRFNLGDINEAAARKPIPEGMTIEQLVEEMEENEDTVECSWCEELFDKSECRFEVGDGSPDSGLGWLCSRCEAAIKSRGETLTFRENNYWDFLDEDVSLKETVATKWLCFFDNKELGVIDADNEEMALEKMQQVFPENNYGKYDGCFWVEPVAE